VTEAALHRAAFQVGGAGLGLGAALLLEARFAALPLVGDTAFGGGFRPRIGDMARGSSRRVVTDAHELSARHDEAHERDAGEQQGSAD
jgi:hypothetical protein